MQLDFLGSFIKSLFNTLVLPKLRQEFGENIPGDIFGDVSAALFELLAGQPMTSITKVLVLATLDNVIRDFKKPKGGSDK